MIFRDGQKVWFVDINCFDPLNSKVVRAQYNTWLNGTGVFPHSVSTSPYSTTYLTDIGLTDKVAKTKKDALKLLSKDLHEKARVLENKAIKIRAKALKILK